MTAHICTDGLNQFQGYLNRKIPEISPHFIQNCKASFLLGSAISWLYTLKFSGGLLGGTTLVVARCVEEVVLKAMREIQSLYCNHFKQEAKPLTEFDRTIAWITSVALTTAVACGVGLPISVPTIVVTNLFFFIAKEYYARNKAAN